MPLLLPLERLTTRRCFAKQRRNQPRSCCVGDFRVHFVVVICQQYSLAVLYYVAEKIRLQRFTTYCLYVYFKD